MASEQKTLTLEVFSNEIFPNCNITDDDDIILASQCLSKKRKAIPNIMVDVKKKNNYESCNPCSWVKTQKKKSPNSDVYKRIKNNLFTYEMLLENDQKVASEINGLQEEMFFQKKERVELPKQTNFENNKCQTISKNLTKTIDLKSLSESSVNPLLNMPILNDTPFLDLKNLNKNMQQSYNMSQALFTDCKTSKIELPSEDEALTSGIILSTQPKKPIDVKQRKHCNQKPEIILHEADSFVKKNMNQNCENISKKDDEITLDVEEKTMFFTLSVSCLIVKCTNTNEIIEKSILMVDDSSKPSELRQSVKTTAKVSKCNFNDSVCSRRINYGENDLIGLLKSNNKTYICNKTDRELEQNAYDESNKKLKWTNEHLLKAKLDELLEISLNNSTKFIKKLSSEKNLFYQVFDRVNEEGNNEKAGQMEEDADMFPSGRVDDAIGVNELTNSSKSLIDAGIFFRTPKVEKEMAIKEKLPMTQELFPSEKEERIIYNLPLVTPSLMKQNKSDVSGKISLEIGMMNNSEKQKIQNNCQLEKEELVLAKCSSSYKYSLGRLIENEGENLWRIHFNDGKVKLVEHNFIIPAKGLQQGDLVLVFNGKNYLSGKLLKINRNGSCEVELDNDIKKINVNTTNLYLEKKAAEMLKKKFKFLKSGESAKNLNQNYDLSKTEHQINANRTELPLKSELVNQRKAQSETGNGAHNLIPIKRRRGKGKALVNSRSKNSYKKLRNKRKKARRSFYAGLPSI